jgi:hypothetical protein
VTTNDQPTQRKIAMTKTKIRNDDDDVFDSRGVLKDKKHVTVSMFMKDGSPNPDLTPAQRVAAAVAATRDAMKTFDASMHRPGFRYAATGTADSAAAADAAITARDAAYSDYQRRQADAWKTGKTKDAPPDGAYSADEASEGDLCTINGAPGKLCAMDDNDEWLICIADNPGDDNSTGDSRTAHDTRTAQQIKDAAYLSYQNDIENAWRRK